MATLQEYRDQLMKNKQSTELQGSVKALSSNPATTVIDSNDAAIKAAQDNAIKSMQTSADAQQEVYQQQIADAKRRADEQYRYLSDFVTDKKNEYDAKVAEDKLKTQAEQKAGAWMGVTELVSGLVNLIGTTAGAANQPHKSTYAADWQKEADRKRQIRKQEMTDLRNRLDQQRLALQNYGVQSEDRIANMTTQAQMAKIQSDANIMTARNRYTLENAQREEIRNQREREEATRMTLAGYMKDSEGNWVENPNSTQWQQRKYRDGSESGNASGNKGNSYLVTVDGQTHKVRMTTETRKAAIKGSMAYIKDDLAKSVGLGSWDELKNIMGGKKRDKKVYESISTIYNMADRGDLEGIESYIDSHPEQFPSFAKSLLSLADSDEVIGGGYSKQSATAMPARKNGINEEEHKKYK